MAKRPKPLILDTLLGLGLGLVTSHFGVGVGFRVCDVPFLGLGLGLRGEG